MDVVLEKLKSSEQGIVKIKSDIEQFDDYFKRTVSGYCDYKLLNERYHNLILSTKDLSSHLANIQNALDYGSQNSDVRIRARNLHSQAITQLRKLQKLGNDVQKHVQLQDKQNAYNATKTDSTLLDLSNDHFVGSNQKQVSLQESEADINRAREMEQLESDIVQVNELFTTLATYIHDQGHLVDSIGDNIEVAYEQVYTGNEKLTEATKNKKSIRRKKCICIIVFIIIFLVIIIALSFSFGH